MQSTIALVRHRVADFDAWKTIYDTFAPIQSEHGVRAYQVLRSLEDRSEVTVAHTFDSIEAAKAFFAMPELRNGDDRGRGQDRLPVGHVLRRGRGRHAGRGLGNVSAPGCVLHAGRSPDRAQSLTVRCLP